VNSYWAEVHTPKNERSIQTPAHESIEFITKVVGGKENTPLLDDEHDVCS
jgi:hypothetical protein